MKFFVDIMKCCKAGFVGKPNAQDWIAQGPTVTSLSNVIVIILFLRGNDRQFSTKNHAREANNIKYDTVLI